ncbi:hypothetical protein ACSBR2_020070 [Camellia fascicularis]
MLKSTKRRTLVVGLFEVFAMLRCKPDAETYNALINAHGRAGQWRWAVNIIQDMLRASVGTLIPYQTSAHSS